MIAKPSPGRTRNVLDRLLRNTTNVQVYSYVDVTSYALLANLPADVVRILPWTGVVNGATGAPPEGFSDWFLNRLVEVGQLLYKGLVALVTFLVDLGEAIWTWGMSRRSPLRSASVKSEGHLRAALEAPMATRFAFWRRIEEDTLAEKHAQPGLLSDFILGSQDGLVNVLGVILGVAVASRQLADPLTIILAGGLAAAFAESISMGAVAYTSTIARRDHYLAEVEREEKEMEELPDLERQEVRQILERWDFHGDELEEMLAKIVSKPKAWLEIMMAHELNLAPVNEAQARKSAVLVGIAAIVGSLIPLVPFLVIGANVWLGVAISLVVSALALFLIGWWKARTTVGRPVRSGTQMVIIGITSAVAGFGIAYLVSGGHVF